MSLDYTSYCINIFLNLITLVDSLENENWEIILWH